MPALIPATEQRSMRDPHVVQLRYKLITDPDYRFTDPPSVHVGSGFFDATLDRDELKVTMKQHFPAIDQARIPVDAFLTAWEVDAGLRNYRGFRFEFVDGIVVERKPEPADDREGLVDVIGVSSVLVSGKLTWGVDLNSYPDPPPRFTVTPLVQMLWRRLDGQADGREPLTVTAYFVYTALAADAGDDWKAAAKKYLIDQKVLKKLSELSSTRGGAHEARKVPPGTKFQPLLGPERVWLEAVVRDIIRQVALVAAGEPVKPISMKSLPTLIGKKSGPSRAPTH